jgi:two-component system chemotaxis sensor kinase CheA
MAKYQKLFLEEASEHLDEISRALLELEKDMSSSESIDMIFRMAHSIKSMAASLGYDSVSELSHCLEDRMETIRSAGCVSTVEELSLLFKGLEGLESMVGSVRETGDPPPPDEALRAELSGPVQGGTPLSQSSHDAESSAQEDAKKKFQT